MIMGPVQASCRLDFMFQVTSRSLLCDPYYKNKPTRLSLSKKLKMLVSSLSRFMSASKRGAQPSRGVT